MSRAPFEFVDVLPSEHPDSDGGSSCRVRGNHLPFGHVLHHEFPAGRGKHLGLLFLLTFPNFAEKTVI